VYWSHALALVFAVGCVGTVEGAACDFGAQAVATSNADAIRARSERFRIPGKNIRVNVPVWIPGCKSNAIQG
jgi:hypothetical protein